MIDKSCGICYDKVSFFGRFPGRACGCPGIFFGGKRTTEYFTFQVSVGKIRQS